MTPQESDKLLEHLNVVDENRGVVLRAVAYLARKSRKVETQALLAALYGHLAVFGARGTAVILLKTITKAKAHVKANGAVPPKG